MRDALAIPHDVRDFYRDAPNGDDVRQSIAWLRAKARPTALTDAFLHIAGAQPLHELPAPPYAETLLVIRAMCERMDWSDEVMHAAFTAEWADAQAKCREVMLRLDKRVRALAFAKNTGEIILSAATIILEEAHISVPREVILAVCRRIAHATVPGHARRAAR